MTSPATVPSLGDERQLLDAVRREEASRLVEPDSRWCGDEPLAGRHQRLDAVAVLTGQQVARREEAEQAPVAVDDEEPGHRQPVGFGSGLSERQARLDDVRLGEDVGEISLHRAVPLRPPRRSSGSGGATPMPPSCAIATAIGAVVTVSMFADTIGTSSSIPGVNLERVETSWRDRTRERRGTSRTSS